MYTKNHNHLMYSSWDTEWDRQNFLSFWTNLFLFTAPLNDPKNMCFINEDHMIYGSWNIRCHRQKSLSFRAIFCPLCPFTSWKINILTLKRAPGDITILHIWIINDNNIMYDSWYMERDISNFLSFWTVFCTFTCL